MSQDSVKSLLCANSWHWDSREEMQIIFEADGTGKLICRSELNLWIATTLEWKAVSPEPLEEPLEDTPKHFTIQIALTKHAIPKLASVDTSIYRKKNGDVLTDDAFSPKMYSLTMERGRFRSSCDQIENPTRELDYELKYGLRLAFDMSPYPPREEWKEPSGAPDAFKFWEMKIFCGVIIFGLAMPVRTSFKRL